VPTCCSDCKVDRGPSFVALNCYCFLQVGPTQHAICALSGGVDSTVAATLVHKVLGDRLHCVFVDHGLLRYKVGYMCCNCCYCCCHLGCFYTSCVLQCGPWPAALQGRL
jgi:hypothetical protein